MTKQQVIFYLRIVPAIIACILAYLFEKESERIIISIMFLLIVMLMLPVILKMRTPNQNELKKIQLSEGIVIIAIYLCSGRLQPKIIEQYDPWFYGMMFLELALTFYGIKKFRMPQHDHLLMTKIFGLITLLWLTIVCVLKTDDFFMVVIFAGLLAYADHFLSIYLLPVYNSKIRHSIDAMNFRKEYKKIYRIK